MALGRILGTLVLAAAGLAVGCRPRPAVPADTGARAAARAFFDALSRREWDRAYAALAPESKARVGPEQFTRLAENYHRSYDLKPGAVQVGPCEEHGPKALAHVTLTRLHPAKNRRHKDAVVLRWDGAGWGVELPAGFGRAGTP